jgi:hypothetical protein
MKSSDLFSELFNDDTEMGNIRKAITFKNFKSTISENISLETFINTEYTKWINNDNPTYIYMCEKYISSVFFSTDIKVSDNYISNILERLDILHSLIKNKPNSNTNVLLKFIEFCKRYISNSKTVFSKVALDYFNDLYINLKKQ